MHSTSTNRDHLEVGGSGRGGFSGERGPILIVRSRREGDLPDRAYEGGWANALHLRPPLFYPRTLIDDSIDGAGRASRESREHDHPPHAGHPVGENEQVKTRACVYRETHVNTTTPHMQAIQWVRMSKLNASVYRERSA
eukprot:1187517-Prorocentrum_minimum.AAC.4